MKIDDELNMKFIEPDKKTIGKKIGVCFERIYRRNKKVIDITLKLSKLIVFISFLYTAVVMYAIGQEDLAFKIIVLFALYLIFNKLEGIR